MRTKLTALALTAALTTGGAALVAPAFAQTPAPSATSTATTAPSAGTAERLAARVAGIKAALAGLVTDGTVTQAQADRVASTLAASDALRGGGRGGHGGHGGRVSPEATARVLGITVEEFRTAREAGQTLAQIATAEGVSRADLISGLVAAAKAQLAADVTAGRLTQAQADEKAATLTARIAEKVDATGRGGRGDRRGATATPSASTTS